MTCILNDPPIIIQCRTLNGDFTLHSWIYNGKEISITEPFDGVNVTPALDFFRIEFPCVPKHHYSTIQCIQVTEIYGFNRRVPSTIATVKIRGV